MSNERTTPASFKAHLSRGSKNIGFLLRRITIPMTDPWDWYIYLHERVDFYGINAGEYTARVPWI